MRPRFKVRATDCAWHTRAAWDARRIEMAHLGHVQATGRAAPIRTGAKTTEPAMALGAVAGATAPLLEGAKPAPTLKERWNVSGEIAPRLGRRARAEKLLTQRRLPIENTTAMD